MIRHFLSLYKNSSVCLIKLKKSEASFYRLGTSSTSFSLTREHSSGANKVMQVMEDNNSVFIGKGDNYRSIHIDSSKESCEEGVSFSSKLQASLEKWKENKVRGVWFRVTLEHADWIPVLSKNGFRFHHADKSGDAVFMCRWLPENEVSPIPIFAHTMVGAGGLVINSKGELLVVQERYKNIPYWKLPGGYIEPGENIATAVIREVLEETNITTEFKSVVGFRHSHQSAFGCSDFYFIVELQPTAENIIKDDKEIEACQWMEIETYLSHPNVHENNRLFLRQYLSNKALGVGIHPQECFHPITKLPQMIYGVSKK